MTARAKWALVIMGAWMMGSICMSVVATENFYTIDRLLETPAKAEFDAAVQKLGGTPARDLLRYLSSELNRLYFQVWNITQLALGGLTLWLLAPPHAQRRTQSSQRPQNQSALWGVIVMLAIVVLMLVYLTPQIVALGRSLDFVPRDPSPPGMQRFWVLHAAYTSLELVKLVGGGVVTWWIASRSG